MMRPRVRIEKTALAFLEAHGAGAIEHPGGTLLAHLCRTADLLASWGASPALTVAGLCHATYGTGGGRPSGAPANTMMQTDRYSPPRAEGVRRSGRPSAGSMPRRLPLRRGGHPLRSPGAPIQVPLLVLEGGNHGHAQPAARRVYQLAATGPWAESWSASAVITASHSVTS